MKVVEKIGWLVFLISLMVFVITGFYGVIKFVITTVVDLLSTYNNHLFAAMGLSFAAGLVGFILIRLGATDRDAEL